MCTLLSRVRDERKLIDRYRTNVPLSFCDKASSVLSLLYADCFLSLSLVFNIGTPSSATVSFLALSYACLMIRKEKFTPKNIARLYYDVLVVFLSLFHANDAVIWAVLTVLVAFGCISPVYSVYTILVVFTKHLFFRVRLIIDVYEYRQQHTNILVQNYISSFQARSARLAASIAFETEPILAEKTAARCA